jgi:tRNA A-37 threonylcarbamoyl transferase component Bud32
MVQNLSGGDPAHIGPYRLHGRLGTGGMGHVFLGRSPGGRLVAVKVVRPELADDGTFRRRFAAEAAAARRVGGFYTAQVVDADPDGDPPWLATAYIPGPSLHQAVADHGPLPPGSVAVLGAGLAEGLAAVHACGVVHRDLKPANVILAEDGPRLIDFGIARALDTTSHTRTATVLGTAAFMSPEQARAERVGPASDVFSLGCVLAHAATGRSPFGDGPVHAVVYRVVHTAPDLAGLSEPLAGLVGACLAKDPAARPALADVPARLTALAATGPGAGGGRWLPDDLTQVIAEHRTLALTAFGPPTGGAAPGGPAPRTAPPHGGTGEAAGVTGPLLAEERRGARGRGPLHPASGLQAALYVLLGLHVLLATVTATYQITIANGHARWDSTDLYDHLMTEHEMYGFILLYPQVALIAALIGVWLPWFRRARDIAERFAPGRLRYRASMAVGGWFIPVGNLFLPKQIADDVWHASSPPGPSGAMAPAGLLHTWWVLWLTTLVTWPFILTPWPEFIRTENIPGYDSLDRYVLDPLVWANLAGQLLAVPAAVVTALFVRRLSALQAARLRT